MTIIFHKWFLRYGMQPREFFNILDCFLPFYSPKNPENKHFAIINKTPGDIIIFHKCTKNNNHMMYGSWIMEWNRQNLLSFWTIFCPVTPLTFPKTKILKKWKNVMRYHDFTQVYQRTWSYATLFLRYSTQQWNFYFSFWAIFCPFTHLTTQKI